MIIKTSNFISAEARVEAEQVALGVLLDAFAKELGAKIFEKMQGEYQGWDDSTNLETMQRKLLTNLQQGDMVDVAALAMFLWNLQQK